MIDTIAIIHSLLLPHVQPQSSRLLAGEPNENFHEPCPPFSSIHLTNGLASPLPAQRRPVRPSSVNTQLLLPHPLLLPLHVALCPNPFSHIRYPNTNTPFYLRHRRRRRHHYHHHHHYPHQSLHPPCSPWPSNHSPTGIPPYPFCLLGRVINPYHGPHVVTLTEPVFRYPPSLNNNDNDNDNNTALPS